MAQQAEAGVLPHPDVGGHVLHDDRVEYYANPVVVGGGTPWLPGGLRLDLRLVEEHRFGNGVVHLACTTGR